jgi:hypothetical protein
MGLARFLRLPLAVDRTADFAERVACRSRLAVWQRVKDGFAGLSLAEARGYIRARALTVVKEETSRLIEQEGVKASRLRERIEAAATAALIETIVEQIAATQPMARARWAA